jgi:hypothetical protein
LLCSFLYSPVSNKLHTAALLLAVYPVKKFLAFMEHESSLLSSQDPATGPDQSSPCPTVPPSTSILILSRDRCLHAEAQQWKQWRTGWDREHLYYAAQQYQVDGLHFRSYTSFWIFVSITIQFNVAEWQLNVRREAEQTAVKRKLGV